MEIDDTLKQPMGQKNYKKNYTYLETNENEKYNTKTYEVQLSTAKREVYSYKLVC